MYLPIRTLLVSPVFLLPSIRLSANLSRVWVTLYVSENLEKPYRCSGRSHGKLPSYIISYGLLFSYVTLLGRIHVYMES